MQIDYIAVYQVKLPMTKTICLSGNRYYSTLDSTIVGITTTDGITGWGESCPYGIDYIPGYAGGVRSGLKELCPNLLGKNPIHIEYLNELMDRTLAGHFYLKSAIDIALWDILGKVSGLAICDLMGGRWGEGTDVQVAIADGSPSATAEIIEEWRSKGIYKFSVKLSGNPVKDVVRIKHAVAGAKSEDDYVFDANKGYTVSSALQVTQQTRNLNYFLEQPCATYEECRAVHKKILHPMFLDECMDNMRAVQRLLSDRCAEGINIKIAKVGGLTKARKIRDLCAAEGILVCLQDTGGSDIVKAAIAHLAHSTPDSIRHSLWDCKDVIEVETATGVPPIAKGKLTAPVAPGLGISVNQEMIGLPVQEYKL